MGPASKKGGVFSDDGFLRYKVLNRIGGAPRKQSTSHAYCERP